MVVIENLKWREEVLNASHSRGLHLMFFHNSFFLGGFANNEMADRTVEGLSLYLLRKRKSMSLRKLSNARYFPLLLHVHTDVYTNHKNDKMPFYVRSQSFMAF